MRKFLVILMISLTSLPVFSASDLKLVFDMPQVKQGELVNATLLVPMNQMQDLNVSKFEGQSLAETIYFMKVSPVVKKEGSEDLESEVKIIFTKVPETNGLTGKVNNSDIRLAWNKVEIEATEGAQELLFGNFEIPKKSKLVLWSLLSVLILVILILLIRIFIKKLQQKKNHKEQMERRRNELLGCRDYDDVVKLWQDRQEYFTLFPHIVEPFKKLEKELYKHQFKPKQTEQEKIEIMDAYRTFKRSIEGGFIGI